SAADVGGAAPAGEDDRDLAGGGGGQGRVHPRPGPAWMRPAGGVEQDPLRAGVEVGPRSLDDRGRRVAPGGDAERLPDRPTGGDDLLDGLVAGELDRIGGDRGDD